MMQETTVHTDGLKSPGRKFVPDIPFESQFQPTAKKNNINSWRMHWCWHVYGDSNYYLFVLPLRLVHFVAERRTKKSDSQSLGPPYPGSYPFIQRIYLTGNDCLCNCCLDTMEWANGLRNFAFKISWVDRLCLGWVISFLIAFLTVGFESSGC